MHFTVYPDNPDRQELAPENHQNPGRRGSAEDETRSLAKYNHQALDRNDYGLKELLVIALTDGIGGVPIASSFCLSIGPVETQITCGPCRTGSSSS